MQLPHLYRVTQQFAHADIGSIHDAVCAELKKLGIKDKLPKGARVGVTAGSRGISNIVEILRTTLGYLRDCGFVPVVIAAMGCHGGGTAEGQLALLASLGITPATLGVPVLSSVETVELGKTSSGLSAYINKHGLDVDGIVVVNRVKPHTGLVGSIQSGLTKGCVVGLGSLPGATQFHSLGMREMPNSLRAIAAILIEKAPIIAGLAIIENGYDETTEIIGVQASEFLNIEPELLRRASELMPRLPSEQLDVLIVEEMGKNYSGTGIDTNVVGRLRVEGCSEPVSPVIRRIVVLDLSDESHGNANGIGCVDFVTDELLAKVDLQATYLNVFTTTFVQRAFIPLHFPTEKKTIERAVASLGAKDPARLRLMITPNTLHLDQLYVSEALLPELQARPNLQISAAPVAFEFDDQHRMTNRLLRRSRAVSGLNC